jgi:hypothetical protein
MWGRVWRGGGCDVGEGVEGGRVLLCTCCS